MTSTSLTIIAALPGAPELPSLTLPAPAANEPVVARALEPVAAPLAEAVSNTPPVEAAAAPVVETTVIADTLPAPVQVIAEVEIVSPPVDAASLIPAEPVIEREPVVVAAMPVEATVMAEAPPETQPASGLDVTAAAETKPAPPADTAAIREATSALSLGSQEPEPKIEDKKILASLDPDAAAIDAAPVQAPPAFEAKGAPGLQRILDEPPSGDRTATDPIQMTNIAMSSPLRIRALTRADIPSADNVPSLAPRSGSAGPLPPESQRVAYDAPVVAEEPTSIGRRRWHEEAAKYQGVGSPEALLEALKHLGAGAKSLGLPASLWCADFMNLVLRKSGLNATGSRAAKSYLQYGKQIEEPRVGAIAIFTRGRGSGGHVGIVRGTDGNGNPIIVSGNYTNKVAEATYPKARVIAYVVPK